MSESHYMNESHCHVNESHCHINESHGMNESHHMNESRWHTQYTTYEWVTLPHMNESHYVWCWYILDCLLLYDRVSDNKSIADCASKYTNEHLEVWCVAQLATPHMTMYAGWQNLLHPILLCLTWPGMQGGRICYTPCYYAWKYEVCMVAEFATPYVATPHMTRHAGWQNLLHPIWLRLTWQGMHDGRTSAAPHMTTPHMTRYAGWQNLLYPVLLCIYCEVCRVAEFAAQNTSCYYASHYEVCMVAEFAEPQINMHMLRGMQGGRTFFTSYYASILHQLHRQQRVQIYTHFVLIRAHTFRDTPRSTT